VHNEDQELVERMLAGHERAFDAFFEAYAKRLAAFVARRAVLPPDAIEDIVQNTFIKVIRSLVTFRGESALFTWVCEICRNEIANSHRTAARHANHENFEDLGAAREVVLELRAPEAEEPSRALDLMAHRAAVAQTLNSLPERYARALEWKYGDGFSVEEIASMMGITPIATQSLLARARLAFRSAWPEEVPL
jgi:RNA polymerase sigma-70 factor (ECF subfamily)